MNAMAESHLICSISAVADSLKQYAGATVQNVSRQSPDHVEPSSDELSESIREVSDSVRLSRSKEGTEAPKQRQIRENNIRSSVLEVGYSVFKEDVAECGGVKIEEIEASASSISILDSLRKEADENLHSDFIAALLTPSTVGTLAHYFAEKLLEIAAMAEQRTEDVNSTGAATVRSRMEKGEARQIAKREVRLGDIDPNSQNRDLADRRIDILLLTDKHVLIIENKINTGESDNQTTDYYRAVKGHYENGNKKICGILLSPCGTAAQEQRFAPMTYFQLFQALHQAHQKAQTTSAKSPADLRGMELCQFYLHELAKTIIQPELRRINNSRKYFEENHYGDTIRIQ